MIGGKCDGGFTDTVELFHVKTRRWYELTNIPQPLKFPSATICSNQLHVIGSDAKGYSCSTESLHITSSDDPQLTTHLVSWITLPHLPVARSTVATLFEQLVIIGGDHQWSSQLPFIS